MDYQALSPVHDLDSPSLEAGLALCLSGGGYRAMLFHAGSLWRLNELGLLSRLQRISSVSGGSITAGALALNWATVNSTAGPCTSAFLSKVIDPIRTMGSTSIDLESVLTGTLFGSVAEHVASHYAKVLFGAATLQDLPGEPRFVFNATNVQSGVLVRFSKPYIRDYRVGQIWQPRLPLALAVAASSAFPPVLSPCTLNVAKLGLQFQPPAPGEDLNKPPYTEKMYLTDGGVYDNLGLETAWKRYDTILISDGGARLQPQPEPHSDWLRHSYRVLDIIDSQVRALRVRQVYELFDAGARKGCYWGIGAMFPKTVPYPCTDPRPEELATVPTRLKALDASVQQRLINWGYIVCDFNLRSRYDTGIPPVRALPYPGAGV